MTASAPTAVPAARWVALVALLGAEVLLLTYRFDTETLDGNDRWWAGLLGDAHFAPQLALTVAVTLVTFGGAELWAAVAAAVGGIGRNHPWRQPLAAHLVAFAGFALLTRDVLESPGRAAPAADGWVAAWVAAGGVSVAAWMLAALPAAAWVRLAGRGGVVIAAATVVGLVAFLSGRAAELLWRPTFGTTLPAVAAVLRVVRADAVYRPEIRVVGAGGFEVDVGPSCSGYEGLGLVAAFLGLFLWLRRGDLRFPQALLLLPVGLAAAWAANVGRIAVLIGIGAAGWPDVARGGFHSQAGWLAFDAIALGLVAAARSVPWLSRTTDRGRAEYPAAPYLAPLTAVVGTAMLTAAVSAGEFDALYPVRVLVAGAVVWVFRDAFRRLGWNWSWAAIGVGGAVFALWLGSDFALDGPAPSAIPGGLAALPDGGKWAWLVGRIAGGVLVVPLAEELAFRGFLLRRLQGAEFDRVPPGRWSWPAVLASALLFGALHPGRLWAGTAAGVLYAWVYSRRGRLADAVVAHAVTNGLLAVYVLATESWWLW